MRRASAGVSLWLAVAALAAGCGSSGDGAGGTTGGGTRADTTAPNTLGLPTGGGPAGAEAASSLHLSKSDCVSLRRRAEAELGRHLETSGDPTPPSSRCRLTGPGTRIGVYLDASRSARQRYKNRMTEQNQFGAPDPGKVVHPVAGVGDPAPGNPNASWVPNLSSLFAIRGNRWLTVAYTVDGVPNAEARDRAADLARLGFRLSR